MRALSDRFQKLFGVTEWFYLREAKLGDREAFGKLYQYYADKIYRFCYFRIGQKREDAEDLAADIFTKAWEKLDTFQKGSFQAWLYMIAKNTIIDYYRSSKPKALLHEEIPDGKESLIDMVATNLEMARITKCMKELTEEQQEVLVLKFIEDLPNREIARIVEKSEEAVRALSSRAIKQLREKLV